MERFKQNGTKIASLLSYSKRWDLTKILGQAENPTPHYCVIDKDGLLLEITGFFPELQTHVAPTIRRGGLQTINVPETGETWRILLHRRRDGIVILGVVDPENFTNVDDRLIKNAKSPLEYP